MKISFKQQKKNKRSVSTVSHFSNLPFEPISEEKEGEGYPSKQHRVEQINNAVDCTTATPLESDLEIAEAFQDQGNKLAEDGRYKEALGKWEAALTLIPDRAVLHEQKAQVLLEIGDAWKALGAATRATELEPSWAEAWITLARTQLNFGEPDAAIESCDMALALKPDSKEAQDDRQTAVQLVKKRKQLQLSGLSASESRYIVGDTRGGALEGNDRKEI